MQAVRARIGGRLYEGVYGLDRPDLLRAHAAWPQCAKSGFKIEAYLLPDDSGVILEARCGDGQWRAFFERSLNSAEAEPEDWLVRNKEAINADLDESFAQAARGESYTPEESRALLAQHRASRSA